MTNKEIEQMIVDNQNLIWHVINKYYCNFRDDEDIFQVGQIGLWKACINYNDARGKFSTLATTCILNEIRQEFRKREKLWKYGNIASLDEPQYFNNAGVPITLGDLLEDRKDDYSAIDYDLSCLKDKLSERDIEIFKLRINGFTYNEIGKCFGFSRSWIEKIVKNARNIAKREMICSYT